MPQEHRCGHPVELHGPTHGFGILCGVAQTVNANLLCISVGLPRDRVAAVHVHLGDDAFLNRVLVKVSAVVVHMLTSTSSHSPR